MDWKSTLSTLQSDVTRIDQLIEELGQYRDERTAQIAHYLRMDSGIDLDLDAIRATATRPYTLVSISEKEAWMIIWRGIRMPIFGQIVSQEPAFIKARVTRTMDLITPFPSWVRDELGWKPPEHKAVIDSTRSSIRLTEGDEAAFRNRYRQFLGGRRDDGTFGIKGGDAWINLVAKLVADGILPYTPTPVDAQHWNPDAEIPEELSSIIDQLEGQAGSAYIHRAVDEFRADGAVLVNYPPGAGKTLVGCLILNHFVGDALILVDSTFLESHWRDRLKHWAPGANVTVSTYQGAAKHSKKKWGLIIPDEAQRFPANTFSKLAFIQTLYRCGLTGTPWREDNRQHLIVALCGRPVTITWAELMSLGVLQRPRVIVATVPTLETKTGYVKSLLARRKGRAIIYCDWLEQGQQLANALDVPFIHGATRNKLQVLEQSDVCVVSRVGDRGLDLPDLRLVVEVAGAGSAREQFAQRVGRLLHGRFKGEFHTVFTPDELQRYRGRFFGVEAEGLEVEFIQVGKVQLPGVTAETPRAPRVRAARPSSSRIHGKREDGVPGDRPQDEIDQVLALPAVAAKVSQAKRSLHSKTAPYVDRAFRYCWSAALSPKEIMEGLGIVDDRSGRFLAACKALEKVGLMNVDEHGRFRVDQAEIQRLRALNLRS